MNKGDGTYVKSSETTDMTVLVANNTQHSITYMLPVLIG